jgi:hypothetical protein
MAKFDIPLSHSQIAVFEAGLESPFNDWDKTHIDQGFSWRPQSVSFATLEDGGTLSVEILAKKTFVPDPGSVRSIRVPFKVPRQGVEIASIISGQVVEIQPGSYSLYYETGKEGSAAWCRFTFVLDEKSIPQIVKADSGLRPPKTFKMVAVPAVQ